MKSIYLNVAKKYEDIIKNIVTDADLDHIDFPLIAAPFTIDQLSSFLPPELVEKLGGLEDDEDTDNDTAVVQKDEEFKEGELEDMKKAAEQKEPQDVNETYTSSTQAAVNDQ